MGRRKSLTARASRNKDKLRKREERQQILSAFHFHPVDTTWRNTRATELGLPLPNISTTTDQPVLSEQLLPPTNFHRILPDGNCFFNALSFVITGHEHFQHVLRRNICAYLVRHNEELRGYLPAQHHGNADEYLIQSGMANDRTWATETEIFTAAHMLNTNIFIYTQYGVHWRWLRHAPRQCDTDRSIYLYHRGRNHYDVVLDTGDNSASIHQDRKLKNKLRMRASYQTDPDCKEIKKRKEKEKYDTDRVSRQAKQQKQKDRYNTDPTARQTKKQQQRDQYSNDPVVRQTKKQKERDKYANPVVRQTKKQKERDKYANPVVRQTKKQKERDKYANPVVRQTKKQKERDRYANPVVRQGKNQKERDKYRSTSSVRDAKKKAAKDRYDSNKTYRIQKRAKSVAKYATNYAFRHALQHLSKIKYKKNAVFRKSKKENSKAKYRSNLSFRATLKASSIKKYSSHASFRSRLKHMLRQQYHGNKDIQTKKKEAVKVRRRTMTKALQTIRKKAMQTFRKNITDTPRYPCTVCARVLSRNQVRACNRNKYMENGVLDDLANKCLTGAYLYDSKEWICKTCDNHLSLGNMPPQALANGMTLCPIPEELKRLNSLEKQLVALRIPFMKLLSLPRGGQRGVKGQVVNVPSNLNSVTTSLPRTIDSAQMVKVKLKRKLAYKGHQQYEWVNPNNVIAAVKYLLANNFWYDGITFNDKWVNEISDSDIVQTGDPASDTDSEEGHKDPAASSTQDRTHKTAPTAETENLPPHPTETCSQPLDLGQEYLDTNNKVFCVAPGENQVPQSIFQEKGADTMAFPVAHPDGNFGFSAERDIKLSPSKYFNARLLCVDDRFAKNNQFIFFAQFMVELYNIKSNISIALRKGRAVTSDGKKVTASTLTDAENLQQVLKSDQGFRFLQPVRGTPPYWQRTMKDLYAMIRQLGIPTWFVTFSAAETRWNEVMEVLKGDDERDLQEMEWAEKSQLIKDNPVMCARMFNNRVKCLFTDLIMSPARPLGHVIDFFYRTEFQQRGSPHIHCLFWVNDAPKLEENTDDEICNFIDQYVSCQMPDPNEDPELHDIVTTVQMHSKSHTKSCKKNSSTCRFKFPRPPIKQTLIARAQTEKEEMEYIPEEDRKVPTAEEFEAMCKAAAKKSPKEIVRDVWAIINSVNNVEDYNIDDILQCADVTYSQFVDSLKAIATKNSVYHKRNLSDSWINNYNPLLLLAWNANMDIQYVMDPYSCVAYILSYISKSEAEIGELLSDTQKEAREGNKDAASVMKKIGQVYIQNREVSAQEAVYRVCGMHLKECSRQVVFVPTGSNAVKMSLPISALRSKEEGSENIWMSSVIDKYYARPEMEEFENMCLAEFCSRYTLHPKSRRPKQSSAPGALPVFELQEGMGFLKRRTKGKEAIIRYPRFNLLRNPDNYYLSLLQMYLPHRQTIIKPPQFKDYEEYVRSGSEGDVPLSDIITANRNVFEMDAEDLEKAWDDVQGGRIGQDAWSMIAPEAEAERLAQEKEKEQHIIEDEEENSPDIDLLAYSRKESHSGTVHNVEYQQPKTSRAEINSHLRSMNKEQQIIFYKVREWALQVAWKKHPEPFNLFVTGGAGTGKSHLIKCIYHELTRILAKTCDHPDAVPVVLTAPTGTAAFNIGGMTLHSAFSISKGIRLPYTPLGESILNTLRAKYDSLQLLIIDEVSMVDHKLLTYINGRLSQIKQSKKFFGNVAVLAVGDFYQLPPVRASPLYKVNKYIALDLWNPLFAVATLAQVMRQKEDASFAAMLNRLRIHPRGEPLLKQDLEMLTSVCCDSVPDDAQKVLHIFSTNKQVAEHNDHMVSVVCTPCISCSAEDYTRNSVNGQLVKRDHPYSSTSQEDLLDVIKIGKGARVMLTRNIDTEDGLVNGAFGTVSALDQTKNGKVKAIFVKFDNKQSGKKLMSNTVSVIPGSEGAVRISQVEDTLQGKNATRKQFPLKLGWAATIHKVQGMTAKEVVVSLDKVFQPGMAYVALSRATSLAGLHILNFDEKAIYASEEIKQALQDMPRFITAENEGTISENSFSIVLHNTEGLLPHKEDVQNSSMLTHASVVCFTETWLNKNFSIPASLLPEYQPHTLHREAAYSRTKEVFRQLSSMERGGVAMFVNTKLKHTRCQLSVENLEYVAISVQDPNVTVITVYRPPNYPFQMFSTTLTQLLTTIESDVNDPVVIVGDFNDDAFSQPMHFKNLFRQHGYNQLVDKPTTESGSCLDLVFVKGLVKDSKITVCPTYYSFHDAVRVTITF